MGTTKSANTLNSNAAGERRVPGPKHTTTPAPLIPYHGQLHRPVTQADKQDSRT